MDNSMLGWLLIFLMVVFLIFQIYIIIDLTKYQKRLDSTKNYRWGNQYKMKLKNLWLAFKDQLPLTRLIRNLWKGHVFGLFSKNSHFRGDTGQAKVTYNTKETATKVAKQMMEKKGKYFSNYKCIWCDGYHLGKNRENK